MEERFAKQLRFLIEIDNMKNIFRQTLLMDGSRRENDAEHSWNLALMAMVLYEYADPGVDLFRVLKMALVHDLVEVYAGDTAAFDVSANEGKEQREQAAANRLFGQLPDEQGDGLRALWQEFDAMQTADSRYAAAMDRFQPFLNNYMTQGHTWRVGRVTREQVYRRMDMVREAAPALWPFVEGVIAEAMQKGSILP